MDTNIGELDKNCSSGSRLINSYGGVSLHSQSHRENFLASSSFLFLMA
ncbi:MAG: hypothetical protein HFG02_00735 [Oscillibacter sp.]|nr:hypothetical protein [Oscillibacter sp.]